MPDDWKGACLTQCWGTPAGAPGLVHTLACDAQLCAACKPALLQCYLSKVLGSRERVAAEDLQAYVPLLRALSAEELVDSVLPNAIRMMKRSPEGVLPTAAALLQSVRVDMDSQAVQLMKDFLPLVRHVKEPVRCGCLLMRQHAP